MKKDLFLISTKLNLLMYSAVSTRNDIIFLHGFPMQIYPSRLVYLLCGHLPTVLFPVLLDLAFNNNYKKT